MISYCTNIHPAESWDETFQAISTHASAIIQNLCQLSSPAQQSALGSPLNLGLGLRLSAKAARELLSDSKRPLQTFQRWLQQNNATVETLNGFPYGEFHHAIVKENVFRPDWTTYERFEYTCHLATILSELAPDTCPYASISTLPASHQWFHADEQRIFAQLDAICAYLHHLETTSGKRIILAMEPEPMGHFDNTWGVIDFFNKLKNQSRRAKLIDRHLGITYDTCHFAIMGESPDYTLPLWEEYGINVAKIQFSNAIELHPTTLDDLEILSDFNEPVYLHQTSITSTQQSHSHPHHHLFADLDEALTWATNNPQHIPGTQWRIHYHIPLFTTPKVPLQNTASINTATITWLNSHPKFSPQLEVETYTWSVLPPSMKSNLAVQIAQEINAIALQLTPQANK